VYEDSAHAPDGCAGFITDLLIRCGRGDEAALGRLFDLFYSLVTAVLRHHGGARPSEEQVVEAFVRLWRQAPAFEPGAQPPVAWVVEQVSATAEPHP
jgi:DNA-directed RNA polymerase specialized sigma24 family protein